MQNLQYQNTSIGQLEPRSGAVSPGECISGGWNTIGDRYWLFLGMSFLAWVLLVVMGIIPILGVIVTAILSGPLVAGLYYAFIKKTNGEPVEFGMMFNGFSQFVPAMIVTVIQSIPGILFAIFDLGLLIVTISTIGLSSDPTLDDTGIVGALNTLRLFLVAFMVIGSLIAQFLFLFALPLIAEHKISAIDAIKLSSKAVFGNIGGLIVLGILEFLILMAGALACGIGIFFVLPIIYAANVFAYRQIFPPAQAEQMNTPPPPTAYGNFGQQI